MNAHTSLVAVAAITAGLGCALPDDGPVAVPGELPANGACLDRGTTPGFATCVDAFVPTAPASFGHDAMPDIVLGAPMPPAAGGSTDVASLGCGGTITLGFADGVPNGPGEDLIVFENAFATGDTTFAEPALVLVSEDGEAWFAFECDAEAGDADGCAGVTPAAPVDAAQARDPAHAGGDAFDLDAVALDSVQWVRLADRTLEHYGDDKWCRGAGGGFDLDAIARVHDP